MANETGPSDLAQGLVRENWGARYIAPLYEKHLVLPRMLNVTGDFKKGDIANIPVAPTYTVGTIGSTGALNVQTATHTNVQVTVDKARDCTVELTGVAREQAEASFENDFPSSAGDALREEMETSALAQYTDVTNTAIGSSTEPSDCDEIMLLAAFQAAITAKLDVMEKPGEYTYALADNQFAPIRKLNILDYSRTGEAGQGGNSNPMIATLWNVPVRFSTQVATSGSLRKGLFFRREAFAWAAQREPSPEFTSRLAAAKWSYLMSVIGLYGVKTVVAGRFWVINTKA